ncbi:hypothetical protein AERO8C_120548 [Aeromonas veronii]|uniref:Uncharacterized protein n=1 Tax=Aeromonas veronii TaxID=654 RepID=A0A653KRZ6_AERVE|nr:hypothetical protein AERO8C_120548 [Aeromonas veronii]
MCMAGDLASIDFFQINGFTGEKTDSKRTVSAVVGRHERTRGGCSAPVSLLACAALTEE